MDLVLPLVLLAAVVAVAAYTYLTRRRRTATRTTPHGGVPVEDLAELDARTRDALVATDDAVRTSREELGFAVAHAGHTAARRFTETLAHAEGELTAAFHLRQEVDDARLEDEVARRTMLEEVLARCAEADAALDDAARDFDELRGLPGAAPEAVGAARRLHEELEARLGTAEAALVAMRRRYAESAAAPVATAPEQARARLDFAADRLARALAPGADAVRELRAAEGALDQAARLVEAVDRRAMELAESAGRLPGALAEAETDLAAARKVLAGVAETELVEWMSRADLRGRTARLEAVLGDVRQSVEADPYDPVDALRRVCEADAALDAALAEVRGPGEVARRARAFLGLALLSARSAVGAAGEYVATHRGVVRSPARTRLAEARRRLAEAETAVGAETLEHREDALPRAQEADGLARSAQALAEQDVRLHGPPPSTTAGPDLTVLAVMGGILLPGGGPARFGGPATRGRTAAEPGNPSGEVS